MNFRQKLPLFFGLLGLLSILLPSTAVADSFDWSYQGTMVLFGPLSFGSGELTTTNGIITGLSGTFDGLAITLLPPGAFAGNDNLLVIPPAPLNLTPNGFSFVDSAGNLSNIYGSCCGTQCTCGPSGCVCVSLPPMYASVSDNGINADIGNFTLTPIAATPEPATLTLLFAAILSIGLPLRWKRGLKNKSFDNLLY